MRIHSTHTHVGYIYIFTVATIPLVLMLNQTESRIKIEGTDGAERSDVSERERGKKEKLERKRKEEK